MAIGGRTSSEFELVEVVPGESEENSVWDTGWNFRSLSVEDWSREGLPEGQRSQGRSARWDTLDQSGAPPAWKKGFGDSERSVSPNPVASKSLKPHVPPRIAPSNSGRRRSNRTKNAITNRNRTPATVGQQMIGHWLSHETTL